MQYILWTCSLTLTRDADFQSLLGLTESHSACEQDPRWFSCTLKLAYISHVMTSRIDLVIVLGPHVSTCLPFLFIKKKKKSHCGEVVSHKVYKGHGMEGMNGQWILALLLQSLLLLAAIVIGLDLPKLKRTTGGTGISDSLSTWHIFFPTP